MLVLPLCITAARVRQLIYGDSKFIVTLFQRLRERFFEHRSHLNGQESHMTPVNSPC